jgi:hypothetical protein
MHDDHQLSVTTIREPDETVGDFASRHRAMVDAAQAQFPED